MSEPTKHGEEKRRHGKEKRRLIDADALIRRFESLANDDWNKETGTTWANAFEEPANMVDDAPTIDAVPVVRCRDCEYGEQDEIGRWSCRSLGCQVGDEDGSGYCADGERREDETDLDVCVSGGCDIIND